MRLAHCSGGRRQSSQQANTGVSVASCRFKLPQKVLGTPALPARQAAGDHYPCHPRKQLQKKKKKVLPSLALRTMLRPLNFPPTPIVYQVNRGILVRKKKKSQILLLYVSPDGPGAQMLIRHRAKLKVSHNSPRCTCRLASRASHLLNGSAPF